MGDQEKERNAFEQKLLASREETVEQQRKLFEDNLAKEKDLLEKKQKEVEADLLEKQEKAELKVVNALNERDRMMVKLEEEKFKAEQNLQAEKCIYEKKLAE